MVWPAFCVFYDSLSVLVSGGNYIISPGSRAPALDREAEETANVATFRRPRVACGDGLERGTLVEAAAPRNRSPRPRTAS